MSEFVVLAINLYFALTFLTSGLSKLEKPDNAILFTLLNLVRLPQFVIRMVRIVHKSLPVIEIFLAIMLVTGIVNTYATLLLIALLILFGALQTILIINKKNVSCGCYGSLYKMRTGQLHLLATLIQLVFSILYYWLTYHFVIQYIVYIIGTMAFAAFCLYILYRRLRHIHQLEGKRILRDT